MKKILLFIIIVFIFSFFNSKIRTIYKVDELTSLYELYASTNNTRPSNFNKKEIMETITSRLECYNESSNYAWRSRVCNGKYIEKIVKLGRERLYSTPDIDDFIRTVALCPTIFNMCVSKFIWAAEKERCIDFERQCIDYALDTHWRGNILYNARNLQND